MNEIILNTSIVLLSMAKALGIVSVLCIVFSCTYRDLAKAKPVIDLGIVIAILGGALWGIDKYLIS